MAEVISKNKIKQENERKAASERMAKKVRKKGRRN